MDFFDIHNIFFVVLGYPMSYLEFFGTTTGAVAVGLTAKANIWGWPIGVVSVVLLFFLFFQVQLYPDMFLQVFFFVTNLLGWWRWAHPRKGEEDKKQELKVSFIPARQLLYFTLTGVAGTIVAGGLAGNLHIWFPGIFILPSAFPYADSFVTVMSIVATFLMVRKKVECWGIWIAVDAIATVLYFMKEMKVLGFEYLVFFFIAVFGLLRWVREFRSYKVLGARF